MLKLVKFYLRFKYFFLEKNYREALENLRYLYFNNYIDLCEFNSEWNDLMKTYSAICRKTGISNKLIGKKFEK